MASITVPLLSTVDQTAGGESYTDDGTEYHSIVDHDVPEPKRNKLGTLNGCYVPCLLNIMGIVLYLRLSVAVSFSTLYQVPAALLVRWCGYCVCLLLSHHVSNGCCP